MIELALIEEEFHLPPDTLRTSEITILATTNIGKFQDYRSVGEILP